MRTSLRSGHDDTPQHQGATRSQNTPHRRRSRYRGKRWSPGAPAHLFLCPAQCAVDHVTQTPGQHPSSIRPMQRPRWAEPSKPLTTSTHRGLSGPLQSVPVNDHLQMRCLPCAGGTRLRHPHLWARMRPRAAPPGPGPPGGTARVVWAFHSARTVGRRLGETARQQPARRTTEAPHPMRRALHWDAPQGKG